MSTIPEFRSIGKEMEELAIALCPYLEKCLLLMFFGLLFGIANYCLLVIGSREMEPLARWACFAAAVWCIFNIIFNYLMTVLVAPGTPSDIPAGLLAPIRHNCRRCGVTKPPRTHHCSICKQCVVQMDHHCPWVGTCVGHHNRKYFINFLTYATLGLAELLCFLRVDKEAMVYALVLTLLLCLGLFSLYHWYIALRGRTSLEVCWEDPRYRPSSSLAHNLRLVYGTANILKCLCPSIAVLRNPGHQWETA